MKYIVLIISGILTLINSSCNEVSTNKRSSAIEKINQIQDIDSENVKIVERIINSYSREDVLHHKQIVLFNPEKTTLDLFTENNHPKIFDIKSIVKGEGEPDYEFIETFYLGDDNGYPIVYTYPITDNVSSVQVITKDRNVISYAWNKKSDLTRLEPIDSFTKETKISAIMFILLSHIMYFDDVNYSVIQKPSIHSMPVMTALKENVVLYEKPDMNSRQTYTLKQHDLLFFLDYSKIRDTIHGQSLPWFKVSTEDKKNIGWLIGLPDNVQYYTDGD